MLPATHVAHAAPAHVEAPHTPASYAQVLAQSLDELRIGPTTSSKREREFDQRQERQRMSHMTADQPSLISES